MLRPQLSGPYTLAVIGQQLLQMQHLAPLNVQVCIKGYVVFVRNARHVDLVNGLRQDEAITLHSLK